MEDGWQQMRVKYLDGTRVWWHTDWSPSQSIMEQRHMYHILLTILYLYRSTSNLFECMGILEMSILVIKNKNTSNLLKWTNNLYNLIIISEEEGKLWEWITRKVQQGYYGTTDHFVTVSFFRSLLLLVLK